MVVVNEYWVVDSGAANHLVRDEKFLQNPVSCSEKNLKVTGFFGKISVISATGDAYLPINAGQHIELRNVFYVPDSKFNLLSVSRLTTDYPFSVIINPSGFVVKNSETNKEVAKGHLVCGGDYIWPTHSSTQRVGEEIWTKTMKNAVPGSPSLESWYNSFEAGDDDAWIVDSGAVKHITYNAKLLHNPRPLSEYELHPDFARRRSRATHIGDVHLRSQEGDEGIIILRDVLLVPESKLSTISVSQFTSDCPSCFEFRSDGFVLKRLDEKNRVIAKGPMFEDWYLWLNVKNKCPSNLSLGIRVALSSSVRVLHYPRDYILIRLARKYRASRKFIQSNHNRIK